MPLPSELRPRGTRAVIGIFALLSLIPVVALGIGLGNVINSGVEQQNLEEVKTNLSVVAQVGIQPLLIPSDLTDGLSNARLDQFDSRLQGVAFGKVIARLKIWNRLGVVVYSDNRDLVAKTFTPDGELLEALGGRVASEITDAKAEENRTDHLTGKFIAVYVPIFLEGNMKTPAGVLELYLPYAAVAAQIQHESEHLYVLLAIGLTLLYLSMIPVFLVVDRLRRRLTASMVSVNEERLKGDEASRVSELKST
ncbi:MAG: hypothetical protein M3Z98_10115, partial [Candidatus Dormibacteraeota bacterium]|nr:hypothetical protein [Candidatus Dormibacteraeota bacterium]